MDSKETRLRRYARADVRWVIKHNVVEFIELVMLVRRCYRNITNAVDHRLCVTFPSVFNYKVCGDQ